MVIKLTSKKYNGDLLISGGRDLYMGKTESDAVGDGDGTGTVVILKAYSKDGNIWNEVGEKDKVKLKQGESIYLDITADENTDQNADLSKYKYLGSYNVEYNRLPSFFAVKLKGKGTAWMNPEAIH